MICLVRVWGRKGPRNKKEDKSKEIEFMDRGVVCILCFGGVHFQAQFVPVGVCDKREMIEAVDTSYWPSKSHGTPPTRKLNSFLFRLTQSAK
jgi:hypothetical protein